MNIANRFFQKLLVALLFVTSIPQTHASLTEEEYVPNSFVHINKAGQSTLVNTGVDGDGKLVMIDSKIPISIPPTATIATYPEGFYEYREKRAWQGRFKGSLWHVEDPSQKPIELNTELVRVNFPTNSLAACSRSGTNNDWVTTHIDLMAFSVDITSFTNFTPKNWKHLINTLQNFMRGGKFLTTELVLTKRLVPSYESASAESERLIELYRLLDGFSRRDLQIRTEVGICLKELPLAEQLHLVNHPMATLSFWMGGGTSGHPQTIAHHSEDGTLEEISLPNREFGEDNVRALTAILHANNRDWTRKHSIDLSGSLLHANQTALTELYKELRNCPLLKIDTLLLRGTNYWVDYSSMITNTQGLGSLTLQNLSNEAIGSCKAIARHADTLTALHLSHVHIQPPGRGFTLASFKHLKNLSLLNTDLSGHELAELLQPLSWLEQLSLSLPYWGSEKDKLLLHTVPKLRKEASPEHWEPNWWEVRKRDWGQVTTRVALQKAAIFLKSASSTPFTYIRDWFYQAIGKSGASVSFEGYLLRKQIVEMPSLKKLHLIFRGEWSKPEEEMKLINAERKKRQLGELTITDKWYTY